MMVTTLGKLRAAWRIFFLCPGSVIPTSLRSWSSITLLPCVWRNVNRHKQINHIPMHNISYTHACQCYGMSNLLLVEFSKCTRRFTSCQYNYILSRWFSMWHPTLLILHHLGFSTCFCCWTTCKFAIHSSVGQMGKNKMYKNKKKVDWIGGDW